MSEIESGQVPIQLQAFPTQAMMTIPILEPTRNGSFQRPQRM